jgi:hypothetical protein
MRVLYKKKTLALSWEKKYNMAMERRRSKRIRVDLKAERISGDSKQGVFIENISSDGIHIVTSPSRTHKEYFPGADVDLKFRLNSGETIRLACKIRWVHLNEPSNGLTDSIGLEILNPPRKYLEFVESIH